jgi:hypothetical protein
MNYGFPQRASSITLHTPLLKLILA